MVIYIAERQQENIESPQILVQPRTVKGKASPAKTMNRYMGLNVKLVITTRDIRISPLSS